jgi:hypothetical protein
MVRRQVSLALSKATASELLASGGIRNEWLECGGFDDGCGGPGASVQVGVRLLPRTKVTDGDVSGEVAQDQRTRAPTVLVYLPILAERVRAIRVKAAGRSNPALATIQTGHLVGLTIAH